MKFEMVSGDAEWFNGAPDWALFVADNGGYQSWEEAQSVVEGNKLQITDEDTPGVYSSLRAGNKLHIIAERRPITEPEEKLNTEWNGEGLPPIGVECEIKRVADWLPVTIKYISGYHTVILTRGGTEDIYQTSALQFRPIRSPEEIARDEAIHAMASTPKPRGTPLYDICVEIYDAIAAGEIKGIKLEASK